MVQHSSQRQPDVAANLGLLKSGEEKFPSSFPAVFLKPSCGSNAVAAPKPWVKEAVTETPVGRAGMR